MTKATIQIGKTYSFVTDRPGRLAYRDQWINKNNSTGLYEVKVQEKVDLEKTVTEFETGIPATVNFVVSHVADERLYADAFYVKDCRGIGHMVTSEELQEI